MNVESLIKQLQLEPHPEEGGFFRETYRSPDVLEKGHLPERYANPRCLGTAIYYLLTPDTCSHMHRLQSDEVFHFYLGDPVLLVELRSPHGGQIVKLGSDVLAGQRVQYTVKRGAWFGAMLEEGGEYALMGTTVCPGFDFLDYEPGERNDLVAEFPDWREWIELLT